MEMTKYRGFYVTYFRQGNTKNGNSMFVLNFFNESFVNQNHKISGVLKLRKDKHNNIKWVKNANLAMDIQNIIDQYLD